jgi:hypothetical protein
MISHMKLEANRRNAQASTGPKTIAGKAASANNARKHGLTASLDSYAQLAPEDQQAFEALLADLREECKTQGPLEEQLLQQYAWSMFLVRRATAHETRALADFDLTPSDANLRRLERMSDYRQRHERAAARARRELGEVQSDRFAANGPNSVLEYHCIDHKMSVVLPCWAMRKATFRKSNQFHFSAQYRDGLPLDTKRLPFPKKKGKSA